jgi:hypothetical protein
MTGYDVKVDALKEFISTFKASLDVRLWHKLIEEELKELQEETVGTAEHLKEFIDVCYVSIGAALVTPRSIRELLGKEETENLRAFEVKMKFVLYTLNDYYSDEVLDEAFNRVHESNMSKLDNDGKPIIREDGKILKGPNYKAPDLSDLV